MDYLDDLPYYGVINGFMVTLVFNFRLVLYNLFRSFDERNFGPDILPFFIKV